MSEFLDSGGLEYLIKNWAPSTAKYVNLERLPDDRIEFTSIHNSNNATLASTIANRWLFNGQQIHGYPSNMDTTLGYYTTNYYNATSNASPYATTFQIFSSPESPRDYFLFTNSYMYYPVYLGSAVYSYDPLLFASNGSNRTLHADVHYSNINTPSHYRMGDCINANNPFWWYTPLTISNPQVLYQIGKRRPILDLGPGGYEYSGSLSQVNAYSLTNQGYGWTLNPEVLNRIYNLDPSLNVDVFSGFALTYYDAFGCFRAFRSSIYYTSTSIYQQAPYVMTWNRVPFFNYYYSDSFISYVANTIGYLFYASTSDVSPDIPLFEDWESIPNTSELGIWTRNPAVFKSDVYGWTTLVSPMYTVCPPYMQTGEIYSLGLLSYTPQRIIPVHKTYYGNLSTLMGYNYGPGSGKSILSVLAYPSVAYSDAFYSAHSTSIDGYLWYSTMTGEEALLSGSLFSTVTPIIGLYGLQMFDTSTLSERQVPNTNLFNMCLGVNGSINNVRPLYLTTSIGYGSYSALVDQNNIDQFNVLSKMDILASSYYYNSWCYSPPSILDDNHYCYALLTCNNGHYNEIILPVHPSHLWQHANNVSMSYSIQYFTEIAGNGVRRGRFINESEKFKAGFKQGNIIDVPMFRSNSTAYTSTSLYFNAFVYLTKKPLIAVYKYIPMPNLSYYPSFVEETYNSNGTVYFSNYSYVNYNYISRYLMVGSMTLGSTSNATQINVIDYTPRYIYRYHDANEYVYAHFPTALIDLAAYFYELSQPTDSTDSTD